MFLEMCLYRVMDLSMLWAVCAISPNTSANLSVQSFINVPIWIDRWCETNAYKSHSCTLKEINSMLTYLFKLISLKDLFTFKLKFLIIYSPPYHPRCLCISFFSRFWWKHSRICIHIVSFNGLQTVEGQNYSFSATSNGYKWYQRMNKGLI